MRSDHFSVLILSVILYIRKPVVSILAPKYEVRRIRMRMHLRACTSKQFQSPCFFRNTDHEGSVHAIRKLQITLLVRSKMTIRWMTCSMQVGQLKFIRRHAILRILRTRRTVCVAQITTLAVYSFSAGHRHQVLFLAPRDRTHNLDSAILASNDGHTRFVSSSSVPSSCSCLSCPSLCRASHASLMAPPQTLSIACGDKGQDCK